MRSIVPVVLLVTHTPARLRRQRRAGRCRPGSSPPPGRCPGRRARRSRPGCWRPRRRRRIAMPLGAARRRRPAGSRRPCADRAAARVRPLARHPQRRRAPRALGRVDADRHRLDRAAGRVDPRQRLLARVRDPHRAAGRRHAGRARRRREPAHDLVRARSRSSRRCRPACSRPIPPRSASASPDGRAADRDRLRTVRLSGSTADHAAGVRRADPDGAGAADQMRGRGAEGTWPSRLPPSGSIMPRPAARTRSLRLVAAEQHDGRDRRGPAAARASRRPGAGA